MKLMIKANTNNEHVYCDFAVIHLNKEVVQDAINRVKSIWKDSDIYGYYTMFCPFSIEFFQESNEEDTKEANIEKSLLNQNKKEWRYLEDDYSFQEVEDRAVSNMLVVDKDGDFWFEADGKYSDVKYYTSQINISEIK